MKLDRGRLRSVAALGAVVGTFAAPKDGLDGDRAAVPAQEASAGRSASLRTGTVAPSAARCV